MIDYTILVNALATVAHDADAAGTPAGALIAKAFTDLANAIERAAPSSASRATAQPEPTTALTGDSLMPWGKHRGIPLKAVPKDYWAYLLRQPEPIADSRVRAWVETNIKDAAPKTPTAQSQTEDVPF